MEHESLLDSPRDAPASVSGRGVDNGEEELIRLVNVTKSFGKRKILAGVNLTIRRGEAVGIIGPSGTGKSTILRIMAGLLEPDSVRQRARPPSARPCASRSSLSVSRCARGRCTSEAEDAWA